jgi:Stage II sporulation protein E (SpoIIE)
MRQVLRSAGAAGGTPPAEPVADVARRGRDSQDGPGPAGKRGWLRRGTGRAMIPPEPPPAGIVREPGFDLTPGDPLAGFLLDGARAVDITELDFASPALTALREAGVVVVIPLISSGTLIGLLNLGPRLSERGYSTQDRRVLDMLASYAAPAMRVGQLMRQQQAEARHHERIEQELKIAQLIQQQFLPQAVPGLPSWHIAAFYRPARSVGGDFYDFIALPDGRVMFVIGDVTDKGVPAALVMASTHALLRGAAPRLIAPGAVLAHVNDQLCADIPAHMFVTCLALVLDPVTGWAEFANAGHDVPYVRTAGGVAELRARGMPLGLMAGVVAGGSARITVLFAILVGVLFLGPALTHQLSLRSFGSASGILIIIVVIAAVGLVVAGHQPGNPIGWLLTGTSMSILVVIDAGFYATYVYNIGHWGVPLVAPAALVLSQMFFAALIPFPLVILLFPDGRLPSPRWRWPMRAYLALGATAPLSVVAVTVAAVIGHHTHVLSDGELASVAHPSGDTAFVAPVTLVFFATVAVAWLSAVVRQVASWRRSSGERRQQLKWLMSGAAICGFSGIWAVSTNSALWEVAIVGLAALPVSIGVGILKYRLYEIDRLISRTLAYAIVTGLLAGVYIGLVTLATQVLPFTSPEAVAVSTLAAAALFNPLRHRVQRAVDRRFNRARYDAEATVAAFAARLQDAVDLDTVRDDLLAAAQRAVEPAHLSVWINRT